MDGVFASLRALHTAPDRMSQPDDLHGDGTMPQPRPLSRLTTPTWEVELLISGVAVFAMLQLLGWLDNAWFALQPRLEASWSAALMMLYIYAKGATLILAITFALHLLLRAHWIAQVGMHSVYPEGIRWERLRIGPVQRELERQRYGGPEAAIERADNRATVVFSIGVTLATFLLTSTAVVALAVAISALLARLGGPGIGTSDQLAAGLALVLAPFLLAVLVDRTLGARLSPEGRGRAVLRTIYGVYGRVGMSHRGNPTMAMVSSHIGERRTILLSTVVMLAVVVAVIWSHDAQRNPLGIGNYDALPAPLPGAARTIDPAHYDDTRDVARGGAVPYVQSLIVREPYLRLVVPYQPHRDNAALRTACRGVDGLPREERHSVLLDCLQRLHPVELDGKPLASLHYDLGSDPRTERPALLAMIDVRVLVPGRHELRVARPAAIKRDGDVDDDTTNMPYRIPFWR